MGCISGSASGVSMVGVWRGGWPWAWVWRGVEGVWAKCLHLVFKLYLLAVRSVDTCRPNCTYLPTEVWAVGRAEVFVWSWGRVGGGCGWQVDGGVGVENAVVVFMEFYRYFQIAESLFLGILINGAGCYLCTRT